MLISSPKLKGGASDVAVQGAEGETAPRHAPAEKHGRKHSRQASDSSLDEHQPAVRRTPASGSATTKEKVKDHDPPPPYEQAMADAL